MCRSVIAAPAAEAEANHKKSGSSGGSKGGKGGSNGGGNNNNGGGNNKQTNGCSQTAKSYCCDTDNLGKYISCKLEGMLASKRLCVTFD